MIMPPPAKRDNVISDTINDTISDNKREIE